MKITRAERRFQYLNYSLLLLFSYVMLYPVFNVFMYSISSEVFLSGSSLFYLPKEVSLEGYRIVLGDPTVFRAYRNTGVVVVLGTSLNIVMSLLMAYPLSKSDLRGRTFLTFFVFLTLLFQGGLIPTYLVVRAVGLLNTLGSLILPVAVNAFYIFILRNFLRTIPASLPESAKMDGASELTILFQIIVPLSKPAIAVLAIMYGVFHWNSWFTAVIYINDANKLTLQPILRDILFRSVFDHFNYDPKLDHGASNMAQVVKMATVAVATVPIMLVYPFLQKYFIKGIMIGALKG